MVTIQGDTWDILSRRAYGSEKYVAELLRANPSLRKTVIFHAGVTIKTPEIDATVTPSVLPPWKKKRG